MRQVTASHSHIQNDLYMDNFAQGLRHLDIADSAQNESVAMKTSSRPFQRDAGTSKPERTEAISVYNGEPHAHEKAAITPSEYHSHLPGTVADGWIAGPVNETGMTSNMRQTYFLVPLSYQVYTLQAPHWK